MENKEKVAVMILNWNGAGLLRRYLPSVVANTSTECAEVIVVDNGSTDNSLQVLEQEFPQVRLIRFDENYGFAEGYNRAVAATDYRYTLLLNSDVRVPAGWIEPLYNYMEAHPEVGACQPKLLKDYDGGKPVFEYAGAAGGYLDCHGYPYCRGRVFSCVEDDEGQYDRDEPYDVFWATGAALMVRSDVYRRAGGLDKDFFAHMEEIDLCWRIHLLGYGVKAVMQSCAYHLGGGSLPASNPRKTYLNFRNNLFLLYKNLPLAAGRRLLLVRRLYDTLSLLMFVATMQWDNAKAVLRAHLDYRRLHHRYDGVQPQRNLLGELPGTGRNIVLDFYLRGKRKF